MSYVQIFMLESLYTTFQTSLLFNFQEVFLVFLVILGYLSSLFTLCCGNAKPDVTFLCVLDNVDRMWAGYVAGSYQFAFCKDG